MEEVKKAKSKYHTKPESFAKLISNKKKPLRFGRNEAKTKLKSLAIKLGFEKLDKKSLKHIKKLNKEFQEDRKILKDDIPELA